MNKARFLLIMVALCAIVAGGFAALAQQDTTEIPEVVIEKSADGYTFPTEIADGIVNITIDNTTEAPAGPLLARLNEDVTMDAFMAELQNGPMAALPLVSLLGGLDVAPNSSRTVTYDLKPGNHVALDFNSEVPAVIPFVVVDGDATVAAPEADVEASLLDFAFTLPLNIPAGEQMWHLTNEGEQWHEMGIMRIDENMSIVELRQMLNAALAESGPGAGEGEPPVAFWQPMNQGEQAWFTLDLEPGTYVIACFLPDFVSGHAHVEMGMTQVFTVE